MQTISKLSDIQSTFDAAVILPTIIRPELHRALDSIFAQKNIDRLQILIGLDKTTEEAYQALLKYLEDIPDHVAVTLLHPGYSTSQRHGGLHMAYDGGSIRTILSFLANSPYLAYIDDDNWWEDNHLHALKSVISDHPWAFSHRNFVHHERLEIICRDTLESLGPNKGIFTQKYGGFVDPNCLMLNKLKADAVLGLWSFHIPDDPVRMSADRLIFDRLKNSSYGDTNLVTVNYVINPNDGMHSHRMDFFTYDLKQKFFGSQKA